MRRKVASSCPLGARASAAPKLKLPKLHPTAAQERRAPTPTSAAPKLKLPTLPLTAARERRDLGARASGAPKLKLPTLHLTAAQERRAPTPIQLTL